WLIPPSTPFWVRPLPRPVAPRVIPPAPIATKLPPLVLKAVGPLRRPSPPPFVPLVTRKPLASGLTLPKLTLTQPQPLIRRTPVVAKTETPKPGVRAVLPLSAPTTTRIDNSKKGPLLRRTTTTPVIPSVKTAPVIRKAAIAPVVGQPSTPRTFQKITPRVFQ